MMTYEQFNITNLKYYASDEKKNTIMHYFKFRGDVTSLNKMVLKYGRKILDIKNAAGIAVKNVKKINFLCT